MKPRKVTKAGSPVDIQQGVDRAARFSESNSVETHRVDISHRQYGTDLCDFDISAM